jgi:hypothetical protein
VDLKLSCKLKGTHQEILVLGLCGVFPNSTIALRIFVSLPASMAPRQHFFNVLKQIIVLGTVPKVCGFKPGRGRWIFNGYKICGLTSLWGSKAVGPML